MSSGLTTESHYFLGRNVNARTYFGCLLHVSLLSTQTHSPQKAGTGQWKNKLLSHDSSKLILPPTVKTGQDKTRQEFIASC